MMNAKVNVVGVLIDNMTMTEAVSGIDAFIETRRPVHVVTPNVDHIVKIQKDAEFRKVYENAGMILADGVPLLWGAWLLETPLKEKISGSDLLPKICEHSVQKNHRLFFLGGRPGAADRAKELLEKKYPGIQIAGTYCPPFGFEKDDFENQKIIRMLLEMKPDILFVGLGAPKQEKWIFQHKHDYQVPVSIGVGASFEFISGMVKRAPLWMQKYSLEWLWRLMSEPGRLWKRYLVEDMEYFWLLSQQYLRKSPKKEAVHAVHEDKPA